MEFGMIVRKRSGPGRKGNLPGPLRRGYTVPVRWHRSTAFKEKAERRRKEGNLSVRCYAV